MASHPENSHSNQPANDSGRDLKSEKPEPTKHMPTLTILPSGRTLEKCFSANGREFTIERPPGDKPSTIVAMSRNSDHLARAKADFGITVDWRVQGVLERKQTSEEVRETAAITQYILKEHATDSDGNISCTLHFSNTEHYGYHFYDHTGDKYWVSTWRNGNHSVGYYSKQPNINYITGD